LCRLRLIIHAVQVRKIWATQLTTSNWGREIRAYMALKKRLRREPTRAERAAALQSNDKFDTVTPKEVTSALDRGELVGVRCP
jgi:hypothetical protein